MRTNTDLRVCGALAQALLLAVLVPGSSAQSYTQISGVITDASGASVPGALVSVVNEDSGFRHTVTSQPDGEYLAPSLQPGSYKITVRKPGFRTMIRFGVRLNGTQPARADFQLVVGSIQETVTVEGSPPLLDAESASVGTVVGREQIDHLPLNGSAALLNLLELSPGVVITPATRGESGQFTVNGQRPNTHYFTVDGISANSGVSAGGVPSQSTGGALPGMTAFGSLDNLISLNALQEVHEQTSSTVSEFGRLPGAQVSVTSRSGSNELHGSLLFGFRNDALDANNWFANRSGLGKAPLRYDDVAATLGGPVIRNRTFFFVAYENMRLSQPFVWRQPVPSLAARQATPAWSQPLLNLFPAPNGGPLGDGLAEWTGNFSRPSRLQSGSARLDQALTSRLSAFARYSDTPSSTEFGAGPVNFLDLHSRGLTLGLNLRARSNLVLDTRLSYSDIFSTSVWRPDASGADAGCRLQAVIEFELRTPNVCNYLIRLSIAGVGDVVSGSEGLRSQSQLHANESVSWNLGRHSLRFGADYRRLQPIRRDASPALSLLADHVSDLTDSSNLWVGNSTQQSVTGVLQEISVYAQDTWRVAARLTLSYGLRWEISPAPDTSALPTYLDPLTSQRVQPRAPTWNSTYGNLAPRFGVAWRLTRSGNTVLRAGGGFYFDSSLSLATDLVNSGPFNVTQFTSQRHVPFNSFLNYGFLPDLRLPLIRQWNVSLEHALSRSDVVTLGYVGAAGRDLVRREIDSNADDRIWLALATNDGSSDYHSLAAQYRRRWSHSLQVIAAYTWSHSIDNSSSDSGLYWRNSGLPPERDQASSDFDVRHTMTAGFSYAPALHGRLLRGWSLDGMFRARTGFPINVLDAEQFTGVTFDNVFRPNRVPGQALWLSDASAPGGRRINLGAFQQTPYSVQGNLGRNALNGFGMAQVDLALRRDFFANDRHALQLRVEAFNATNHPNFGDPIRFLSSTLFGQSSSMLNLMLGTGSPGSGLAPVFQSGGARSLRVALRFTF